MSNKDADTEKRNRRAAVVLCGGQSRRMGKAKAWLKVGDETMLGRITRILDSAVSQIIVVAAEGQKVPPVSATVSVITDQRPGLGPLQGIATGLKAVDADKEAAFVSACDTPLLKIQWVTALFDRLTDAYDLAVPCDGKFAHVLSAVYRPKVQATAERLIRDQNLRPLFLTREHPTLEIHTSELARWDPELDSLKNLNTEEDYEKLIRRLDDS